MSSSKKKEIYHLYPWNSLDDEQVNDLKRLGRLEIEYILPEFTKEDPLSDYARVMYWDEFSNDDEFRNYWINIPSIYENVHGFLFNMIFVAEDETFRFSDYYNYVVNDYPIYKDSEQRLRSILEHYLDERVEYDYHIENVSDPHCLYDVKYKLIIPRNDIIDSTERYDDPESNSFYTRRVTTNENGCPIVHIDRYDY